MSFLFYKFVSCCYHWHIHTPICALHNTSTVHNSNYRTHNFRTERKNDVYIYIWAEKPLLLWNYVAKPWAQQELFFWFSLVFWGFGNYRTNGYSNFLYFPNPQVPFCNSVTSHTIGPYHKSHQYYSISYWGSIQSIAGITVFQPVEWKDRGFWTLKSFWVLGGHCLSHLQPDPSSLALLAASHIVAEVWTWHHGDAESITKWRYHQATAQCDSDD